MLRGLYAEDPAETAPGKNICYNEKKASGRLVPEVFFYEKWCEAVSRSDLLSRLAWRCQNESAEMSPVSPGAAKMSQPERLGSPGAAKTSQLEGFPSRLALPK